MDRISKSGDVTSEAIMQELSTRSYYISDEVYATMANEIADLDKLSIHSDDIPEEAYTRHESTETHEEHALVHSDANWLDAVKSELGPDEMKAIQQKIAQDKLGLRVGRNTEGAAYSMSDLFPQQGLPDRDQMRKEFQWKMTGKGDDLTEKWVNNLYNTLTKISELTKQGEKFNLLIVTRASGSSEAYKARGGIGDTLTFPKANRLPTDASILTESEFGDVQVKEAFAWVLQELKKSGS